jgi:hypothetical protein
VVLFWARLCPLLSHTEHGHVPGGTFQFPAKAVGSCGLPGYKPVSVPLRAAVIHLGRTSLPGSSDLPGSKTERTAPPPLFGLAPRGVCPAGRIAPSAVRSYRTFSPLPVARRYIFCGTFRKKHLEVNPPGR